MRAGLRHARADNGRTKSQIGFSDNAARLDGVIVALQLVAIAAGREILIIIAIGESDDFGNVSGA